MSKDSRLVYSTDHGRIKPTQQPPAHRDGDGVVRVRRETSGRRGSAVTTISGITLTGDEMKTLIKQLKRLCGGGGTLKNGVIEIQGDHRKKLVDALVARGFTVKLAGG